MTDVIINEVGPRDGLQNEPGSVTPENRASLINRLVSAGIQAVEVGSFVSPKAVPSMAGTGEVVQSLNLSRADFSALVPNSKGYELAVATGLRSIAVVLGATRKMNLSNINMDLDQATEVCEAVVQQAQRDGIRARAYIAVAVECPFEGLVSVDHVEQLSAKMFDAGATEVIIADTIGAANPAQIKTLFNRLIYTFGAQHLSAHFHDTRAMALANAWQALECGIRKFDASIGGLGGCPFAPGAAGNLATEDLVSMLNQSGFRTGIELSSLLDTLDWLGKLVGHPTGGRALPWLNKHFKRI